MYYNANPYRIEEEDCAVGVSSRKSLSMNGFMFAFIL